MADKLTVLLTEYRLAFTAEAVAQRTDLEATADAFADEKRRDKAAAALLAYLVAEENR